jgi:clan AA aspartic protease
MIRGAVKAREARIRLTVRGPRGQEQEVEAVIDTGYTAWLALPPALVATLALRWESFTSATLADGTTSFFDVHHATVIWDERARRVPVDGVGTVPLVGMRLLHGHELKVQVRAGGKVTITKLVR